jgi:hypothetical protein
MQRIHLKATNNTEQRLVRNLKATNNTEQPSEINLLFP